MTTGHLVPPEPPPGNPEMYTDGDMLYIRQDVLDSFAVSDTYICGERLTYYWGEQCGKYRRRDIPPTAPKEDQK